MPSLNNNQVRAFISTAAQAAQFVSVPFKIQNFYFACYSKDLHQNPHASSTEHASSSHWSNL